MKNSGFKDSISAWEPKGFKDFILACELKVGIYRQLLELMMVCQYSRSRSLTYEKIKLAILRNHCAILTKVCM